MRMGLHGAVDTLLHNGRGTIDAGSKVYGVVPAIVTAVNDKKKSRHLMGMVEVYFPWLQNQGDPSLLKPWARCLMPNAGGGAGFYSVPQIGDEVVVGFEHGDPHFPYVLGSLWNGENKVPMPTTDKDKTDCPGYGEEAKTHKTPDLGPDTIGGDKGSNKTYFWRGRHHKDQKGGNLVIVDDKEGTIRIEEQTGNSVIQLEKGDIKILEKTGDIHVWAKDKIRFDCENFRIHASNRIFFYAKQDWGCKVEGKKEMACKMNFQAMAKASEASNGTQGIIIHSKNDNIKIDSGMAMDIVANQNMLVKATSADIKVTALMALGMTSKAELSFKAANITMNALAGINWAASGHVNIQAGAMIACKSMCINLN